LSASLSAYAALAFDEAQLTAPIGGGLGPGPQFTLTASVVPNAHYLIAVTPVDFQGKILESATSEVWSFTWTPPVVLQSVPWPARPLPPVRDFDTYAPGEAPPAYAPRVAARAFYNSDGFGPNPRYPVGVRIGQLDTSGQPNANAITDHTDEYLNYFAGNQASRDPNSGVFRARGNTRSGQPLLPIVIYRQQLTNLYFPLVSGDVTQVSPLIERVPWTIDPNLQVTIPDRLFAGEYEDYGVINASTFYFFYVRDLQPVQLGAKYRYYVVRFNNQREVQDIIPAGDVELPLN
jgi:hypothetical protein